MWDNTSTDNNQLHHVIFLCVQFLVEHHRMLLLHNVVRTNWQYPGLLHLEIHGMDEA